MMGVKRGLFVQSHSFALQNKKNYEQRNTQGKGYINKKLVFDTDLLYQATDSFYMLKQLFCYVWKKHNTTTTPKKPQTSQLSKAKDQPPSYNHTQIQSTSWFGENSLLKNLLYCWGAVQTHLLLDSTEQKCCMTRDNDFGDGGTVLVGTRLFVLQDWCKMVFSLTKIQKKNFRTRELVCNSK